MGRFMQYYREHARYLERTYDFVERVGIGELRRLLVDDAEGICAGPRRGGAGGGRRVRRSRGRKRRRRCTRCSSRPSSRPSKRSPWHDRDGDGIRPRSDRRHPARRGAGVSRRRTRGRGLPLPERRGASRPSDLSAPRRSARRRPGRRPLGDLPAARLRVRPAHRPRARGATAIGWSRIASRSRRAARRRLELA